MLSGKEIDEKWAIMSRLEQQITEARADLAKLELELAEHVCQMEKQFQDRLRTFMSLVEVKIQEVKDRKDEHFGKSHE